VAVANSVMPPTQSVGCVKVVVIIMGSADTVVLGICVVVVDGFELELEDDDLDVIDVDDVEIDDVIAVTPDEDNPIVCNCLRSTTVSLLMS
jgi:hypothetical protein